MGILRRLKQVALASKWFRSSRESDNEERSPRADLEAGEAYFAQGDLEKAKDAFLAASASEDSEISARAFAMLGLVQRRLGDPEAAQAAFDSATNRASGKILQELRQTPH
jgi:TolA-binding protein